MSRANHCPLWAASDRGSTLGCGTGSHPPGPLPLLPAKKKGKLGGCPWVEVRIRPSEGNQSQPQPRGKGRAMGMGTGWGWSRKSICGPSQATALTLSWPLASAAKESGGKTLSRLWHHEALLQPDWKGFYLSTFLIYFFLFLIQVVHQIAEEKLNNFFYLH